MNDAIVDDAAASLPVMRSKSVSNDQQGYGMRLADATPLPATGRCTTELKIGLFFKPCAIDNGKLAITAIDMLPPFYHEQNGAQHSMVFLLSLLIFLCAQRPFFHALLLKVFYQVLALYSRHATFAA
jgi:hypothetical protein